MTARTPNFPDFDDLTPTTVAAVTYFNATIDFATIYANAHVVKIDPRIDSLKKRDKKGLMASCEKGLLLSVRYLDMIRGYPRISNKKVWCGQCQLMELKGDIQVKVKTAVGQARHVQGEEWRVVFKCQNCKKAYTAKEMCFHDHFKNQIMFDVTTGHNTINIMTFQGKMKITGANSEIEPLTMAAFFWHNYIKPIPGSWTLDPRETHLKMAMQTIMCNINFSFGLEIDADRLLKLWLDGEYADDIDEVKASNPAQKNIKIKFTYDPESDRGLGYALLSFVGDGPQVVMSNVESIPFPHKRKPSKVAKTTAIVFTSSATILSGKNMMVNRSRYEFFRRVVEANAQEIQGKYVAIDKKKVRALLE